MGIEKILPLILQVSVVLLSVVLLSVSAVFISKRKLNKASVFIWVNSILAGTSTIVFTVLYVLFGLPFFVFLIVLSQLLLTFSFVVRLTSLDLDKKYSTFLFLYQGLSLISFVLTTVLTKDNLMVFPILYLLLFITLVMLLHIQTIRTIFSREIQSFYVSPLYYVLGFIFLMLTGFFFTVDIAYVRLAMMQNSIYNIGFFSNFFLSILCIKLISEERSSGTFEIVMTSPIESLEFVTGKYLSAFIVYLSLVAMTLVYPSLLFYFGEPDLGVVMSGYTGLVLFGAGVLGLGLIATSLTRSHLIAAIIGVSLALGTYIISWLSEMVLGARTVLRHLSVTAHFNDFTQGLVDLRHIFFFLLFTAATITISTLIVESYKWR